MQALWRTLILCGAALGLVLWGLPLLHPYVRRPNDFFQVMDRKLADQAHVASPRVLLVGGSNLVFGLSSAELERCLGRPVYNLAFSAELGIPFMARVAEACARPGDVVLFSPEYGVGTGSCRAFAMLSLESPRSAKLLNLSLNDRIRVAVFKAQITGGMMVEKWLLRQVPASDVYRADGYDRFGDLVSHANKGPQDFALHPPAEPDPPACKQAVAQLVAVARQQGFKVLHLPPAYSESGYRQDSTAALARFAWVQAAGMQAVCRPEAMIFADSFFYDTPYHTLRSGARLRARRVARMLLPALGKPCHD